MGMKEPPGSLRLYLILVGGLVTGYAIYNIVTYGAYILVLGLNVVSMAFGIAMLVGGALTTKLLRTAPVALYIIVWGNVGWRVILTAIVLIAGAATSRTYIDLAISLGIAGYLTFNIKRLSQEADPRRATG